MIKKVLIYSFLLLLCSLFTLNAQIQEGQSISSFPDARPGDGNNTFNLLENDTLRLLTVNRNVFGAATKATSSKPSAFNRPSFVERIETNTNAIRISFRSNEDFFEGYTVIERADPKSEFIAIDSIKTGDISNAGSGIIYYVDGTVEPNREYFYRLLNKNDTVSSLYSEETKRITSTVMPAWKLFRPNSLEQVLESIESQHITNMICFDEKIFFLSAEAKNAYYFDLVADELVRMEDIPLPYANDNSSIFSEVDFINNKLYCFTPNSPENNTDNSVFVYDIESDSWEKRDINNLKPVKYAARLSDHSYVISFEDETLATFDTQTNTVVGSNLTVEGEITYIQVTNDSILIFDKGKRSYSADKNLSFLKSKASTEILLEKDMITEYQNVLTQASSSRISEIDFSASELLKYVENFPYGGAVRPLVFSYQDTLVYFDGLYNSFISSFYYRDTLAPGQLIIGAVDSIGYKSATVRWFDSPDETAYQLEIENNNDEVLSSHSLPENTTSFKVTDLSPDNVYWVRLTPIKNDILGTTKSRRFYTKDAPVPLAPFKVELTQVSVDSLALSWELLEPIDAVDSINIEGVEIKSTGQTQTYRLKALPENSTQYVSLFAFNQWKRSEQVYSDTILTRLYTPIINEDRFYEFDDRYEITGENTSKLANAFALYRKSAAETDFSMIQTQEEVSGEVVFEDFVDDPSLEYEYYVVGYLLQGTSRINESFPSKIIATENSILSNSILNANDIIIFPNPVEKHIYVTATTNLSIEKIEVLSVEGKLIKSFAASEVIDVSELERGIYLLKVKATSGELIKRFIKE